MSTPTQAVVTVEVTVADFDGTEPYRVARSGIPIDRFTPYGRGDYHPRGRTPLRDAVASYIADLASRQRPGTVAVGLLLDRSGSMAGKEDAVVAGVNEFVAGMAAVDNVDPESDGKVFAVILTDGLENYSREVSVEQLGAMIKEKEDEGWTFIYLGANQDAWAVGQRTGFSGGARGQTVSYASTDMGTRSAVSAAGASVQSFLSDNATYDVAAAAAPQRTVMETGEEVAANVDPLAAPPSPPAPPAPEPESPYKVADAVRAAQEKLSRS